MGKKKTKKPDGRYIAEPEFTCPPPCGKRFVRDGDLARHQALVPACKERLQAIWDNLARPRSPSFDREEFFPGNEYPRSRDGGDRDTPEPDDLWEDAPVADLGQDDAGPDNISEPPGPPPTIPDEVFPRAGEVKSQLEAHHFEGVYEWQELNNADNSFYPFLDKNELDFVDWIYETKQSTADIDSLLKLRIVSCTPISCLSSFDAFYSCRTMSRLLSVPPTLFTHESSRCLIRELIGLRKRSPRNLELSPSP